MGINPKNKFKENMKKNLLQEAIADADAIKKLAVQNAKESLNLAFDSKIKSMVDSRLNEEADDMEYDEEDQDEAKKHAEPDADQEGGKSDHDEDNKEDADEAFDIDAILAEMEDDTDDSGKDDLDGEKLDESDDDDEDVKDKEEEEKDKEEDEDSDSDSGDSADESFNLEALLAELAEEEGIDESAEEEEEEEESSSVKEGEDKGLALSIIVPILQKAGVKQETIDKIIKGAKDMATAMHNQGVGMGEAKKKKPTDDENDGYSNHKLASKKDDNGDDLENIKEQMELLASKVKETNLINAKLLYVNKILRENDLSVEQKIKVVNAFDRATSTKEAKIVYSSLSEAFKVKSSKPKTNLKESLGFASKAAGTSTKREIVTEADAQVTRWQKLAGIKLND